MLSSYFTKFDLEWNFIKFSEAVVYSQSSLTKDTSAHNAFVEAVGSISHAALVPLCKNTIS